MTVTVGNQLWYGWASTSMGRRTFTSLIIHIRYINEALDVYVRPYAIAIRPDFIFMDNNARAHRARVVNENLETTGIVRMDWTAQFLDLNTV